MFFAVNLSFFIFPSYQNSQPLTFAKLRQLKILSAGGLHEVCSEMSAVCPSLQSLHDVELKFGNSYTTSRQLVMPKLPMPAYESIIQSNYSLTLIIRTSRRTISITPRSLQYCWNGTTLSVHAGLQVCRIIISCITSSHGLKTFSVSLFEE